MCILYVHMYIGVPVICESSGLFQFFIALTMTIITLSWISGGDVEWVLDG